MPIFSTANNFKKILYAFISVLGVALIISCKNKKKYATAASNNSLLWEISGKDLPTPSYFLGTMHLMCAEDAHLSQNVQQLIKTVDQVYLEVDMDNASELFSGLLALRNNKAQTLENTLSKEDYEKVKTFFTHFQPGAAFSVLEQQPPLMLTASLYELLLPCDEKNGIELKIVDAAYKAKTPTKGLETIAYQAAIFDSIPYEEQAKDLVNAISSIEKGRKSMQQMLQAYRQQDVEQLYTLSAEEDSLANHLDILLFKRNKNWVNQFAGIAKRPTLFAVGAGHLGGPYGVLALLRKQGYTLRPIENN